MITRGSVIVMALTPLLLGGCGLIWREAGILGMGWITEECLKGFKTEGSVQKLLPLPGEKLVIASKVGSLVLKTWDRPEIQLIAEKKAKGFPPEELGIEVSRGPGELKVKTKTPWWLDCQRAFAVDLFFRIPKGLDVEADLILGWGGVKLEGDFTGRVRVRLDQGDIRVLVPPEASLVIEAEIGDEGQIDTDGLGGSATLRDRTEEIGVHLQAIEAILGRGEGHLYISTRVGTISLEILNQQ